MRKGIRFIWIFLFLFSGLVFSQEKQEKKEKEKTLFIRSADQITYSQEKDGAGYHQAVLFGNVFVVYENRKIYADELIIKFSGEDPKEIIASGNIIIETDSSIVIGEKLFFYPETKKGLIYQAATFNKPYFIRGDYFKFVGEEKLIIDNMLFTTCEEENPHYALGASKSWIYQDDKDMFLGFQIRTGQDPIFYFPFMYRSYYGTGLITSLGQEKGLGWFLNNTYTTKGKEYSFKLMLDHYQKTGEYFGVDASWQSFGKLDLKAALIYDRHVKYESGEFKNFFVEVQGEKPVSGRSVRYKADVGYEKQVLDGDNPLGLTTSVKGKFYEPTDPFIESQYESRRMDTFDIKKILFPETSPSSMAGNFSSGSGSGRKAEFSITNAFYGFNLALSGNWNYSMSKTTDPEKAKNPYQPGYYQNYKSSVIFPSITLNKNFALFDLGGLFSEEPQDGQKKEDVLTVSWPYSLTFSGSYIDTRNYSLDVMSSRITDTKADLSLSFPFSLQWQKMSFKLPFTLSGTNLFSHSQSYSAGSLSADVDKRQHQFQLASPPTLELLWESSSFTSTVPLTQTYTYYIQNTRNATSSQTESDKNNTFLLRSLSLGSDNKYGFLTDYEYLESYLQAKVTYSTSQKSGERLPDSQKTQTKTYQYLLGFSTLKTSFNLSTETDLSDNVTEANRKKPYTFTMNSQLIPFFTFQDTYIYDRYRNTPQSNSLGITGNVKSRLDLIGDFWLNSLSFSFNWFKSYQQKSNQYLTYQFSIDFNLTEYWQFSLVSSGKNYELYRYTDEASASQRKDFWEDLYKSVKLWSVKDRQESSFKMSSFGLNIKHNLHKWTMELTSSFTPKVERNGAFYFESAFTFQLTLKELPSLSPPEIKKTFGGSE